MMAATFILRQTIQRSFRLRYSSIATSTELHKLVYPQPVQSQAPFHPQKFTDLSLHPSVVSALAATNKHEPRPIQVSAIPSILSRKHTLIAAETGSGKTLAYLVPLISNLKTDESLSSQSSLKHDDSFVLAPMALRPSILILQPTRELADQALRIAKSISHVAKFRVRGAFGGSRRRNLDHRISNSPIDLLIATPGSVSRLLESKKLYLSRVNAVVLDEADELLKEQNPSVKERKREKMTGETSHAHPDRYFASQLHPILSAFTRENIQFVYAAATVPARFETWLHNRHRSGGIDIVKGERLHKATGDNKIKTTFIRIDGTAGVDNGKLHKVVEIVTSAISRPDSGKILIFCDAAERREDVINRLKRYGISAVHLGGDSIDPWTRDQNWAQFRDNAVRVAVCARSFARGIDDSGIATVLMVDVPLTGGEYLHRVGRIRHAGRVYVLVGPKEEKIAETLFLAHVKGSQIADVNAKKAWEAHLAASQDRIESDPKVRQARKNRSARWVDERASKTGSFRGRSGRRSSILKGVR